MGWGFRAAGHGQLRQRLLEGLRREPFCGRAQRRACRELAGRCDITAGRRRRAGAPQHRRRAGREQSRADEEPKQIGSRRVAGRGGDAPVFATRRRGSNAILPMAKSVRGRGLQPGNAPPRVIRSLPCGTSDAPTTAPFGLFRERLDPDASGRDVKFSTARRKSPRPSSPPPRRMTFQPRRAPTLGKYTSKWGRHSRHAVLDA